MSDEGNTMEPVDRVRAAISKLEDVREHSTQGDSYEEAKADVAGKVPDGWELMDVRADKS